jgi:hypothetical protein
MGHPAGVDPLDNVLRSKAGLGPGDKSHPSIDHMPKVNPCGRLPFERRCPSNRMAPAQALGAGFCAGAISGERRKAANNVRGEPITFRFPALSCFAHFSSLPQVETAFGPGHRV